MGKGKTYISSHPDNPPEWYWISGLHDACIMGIESFEFPFDYNKFALVDHDSYYTLEIDMQDFDSDPEDFTFKIKFERAEVLR